MSDALQKATQMMVAMENGKLIAIGWYVPEWKKDIKDFYKEHAGRDIRILPAAEAKQIMTEQW